MKKIILIMSFVNIYFQSIGQNVYGYIFDSQSKGRISNCSIHIMHKPIGVISNKDGYFKLHHVMAQDTLVISFIGYKTIKKSVHDILVNKQDTFYLNRESVALPEVTINQIHAKRLLKICIEKSNQSLMQNVLINAYYREYVKFNDTIKKFSDGIVDFYVEKKFENFPAQVKCSRTIDDLSKNTPRFLRKFFDAVPMKLVISTYFPKNISFFNLNSMKKYNYSYCGIKQSNQYFILNITPKNKQKHAASFKIYINKTDTLLYKIESNLLPNKDNTIISKSSTDITKLKGLKLEIRFRNLNHQLFLSHYRSDIIARHNLYLPKRNFNTELMVESVTELMVSDLKHNIGNPIAKRNYYKEKFLYQNGTHFKNPFWETENIISGTPEEKAFMSKIKDSSYSSTQ